MEAQIQEELDNVQYITVEDKPLIVSALGAIPKRGSSKVRLIHDASRPVGSALNDLATADPFRYQTLTDARNLVKQGSYMAKVDLANAYRVVRIHPSNYQYTGLKWTFKGQAEPTYMVDTRLPFGAKKSPMIFNELTQAVRRIMAEKGYRNIVVYLDDFLVVESSYELCQETMNVLLSVLRELGFRIRYKKIEGPACRLPFLGVILDSISMTLELPRSKCDELRVCLLSIKDRSKVTKKGLQSLAGKLNWASLCIYGGRSHLRRVLDKMNALKRPHHRTRVTRDLQADIDWWLSFMDVFNGTVQMVECRPTTAVTIDACDTAAGAFFVDSCLYTPWDALGRDTRNLHINFKEVMALEPAAQCWAPAWENKTVFVYSDNRAAVAIVNKGSCKNPIVMDSLRRVFWLSAVHNFRLKAVYYPGRLNRVADSISRLHEPGGWDRLQAALLVTLTQPP